MATATSDINIDVLQKYYYIEGPVPFANAHQIHFTNVHSKREQVHFEMNAKVMRFVADLREQETVVVWLEGLPFGIEEEASERVETCHIKGRVKVLGMDHP